MQGTTQKSKDSAKAAETPMPQASKNSDSMVIPVHSVPIEAVDKLTPSWQRQLSDVIENPAELLRILGLSTDLLPAALAGSSDFQMRVPRAFVQRMQPNNLHDPLLRQVLPLNDEQTKPPAGYSLDPLGEAAANPKPGIVHKYRRRVLLITNGHCAVNCRYCFRRHFPYEDNHLSLQAWNENLDYIRQDTTLNEVILSGGDPLASSDKRLFKLINSIRDIPHIQRIRIHTRLPIVIPDRITDDLLAGLTEQAHRPLNIIVVVHANHAQEIDDAVGDALLKMNQAGMTVLNQSVLLAGINDCAQTLCDLSERLFQYRTLPYYLHLLDPVIGAQHFDVPEKTAKALIEECLLALPGFLVPKLVREIASEGSKTPI